jgi:hypothetical protein
MGKEEERREREKERRASFQKKPIRKKISGTSHKFRVIVFGPWIPRLDLPRSSTCRKEVKRKEVKEKSRRRKGRWRR